MMWCEVILAVTGSTILEPILAIPGSDLGGTWKQSWPSVRRLRLLYILLDGSLEMTFIR